jgi:hypothetical protein
MKGTRSDTFSPTAEYKMNTQWERGGHRAPWIKDAIVIPETTIKNRMRSQTMIVSPEQEAIVRAIYISKEPDVDTEPDEATKNALEEDINDHQELYPPQDLINWMKKTDAKSRQKRWAQGENTMRFRKETI